LNFKTGQEMELSATPLIRASIVIIMLFQVAAHFVRSYLQIELVESGFDTTVAKHLSYLVVPVILLVLMWPILHDNKDAIRSLFRRPKSWPMMVLAAVGLGVALRLAWWAAVIAAGSFGWLETAAPGHGGALSFYFACPPVDALFLTILVMAIFTPLEEEFVFRGVMLGALSQKDSRIAVVVTSLLFALMHEPSSIPTVFIFGIFAAVLLLRSQTLWAPIVAHGTYNFMIVIDWDCFHGLWVPEQTTIESMAAGSMAILACMTCLAVAIWIVGSIGAGED
jgi:membrane protease YdiL (CAAX protease family)